MVISRSALLVVLLVAAICALTPSATLAQTAPAKQLRMVLTYPPGRASDLMGRITARKLGEIWGQPGLVESKPGANGSIGIDYAAKQPADGSSFVIGNLG